MAPAAEGCCSVVACVPASARGAGLEFTSLDFARTGKNMGNVLLGLWPRGRQLWQTAGLCRGTAISIAATCAVAQPWGWRCTRLAARGFGSRPVRGNPCCCAWPEGGKKGPLHSAASALAVPRTGARPAAAPAGGCSAGRRGSPAPPRPLWGVPAAALPLLPPPARVPLARFLSSSNIEGRRADGSAPRPPPRSPPPSRWRRAGGAPRLARGAG